MENKDAAVAFAALGLEGRLNIVTLLQAAPDGLSATEVATALGGVRGAVPRQSSVSSQLSTLAHAAVTTRERRGRQIVYRINTTMMEALARNLVAPPSGRSANEKTD